MKVQFMPRGRWPMALLLWVFFLLLAGAGNIPAASAVAPRDLVLFTAVDTETMRLPATQGVLRERAVSINPAVMDSSLIRPGDRLWVAPFIEGTYVAVVDLVEMDVNGVLAVRGRVEGWEGAFLLLSSRGGLTLGTLNIPGLGLEWEIRPGPDNNQHFVSEMDLRTRDLLADAPPLEPPLGPSSDAWENPASAQSLAAANALSTPARLDIMVVYTPAARDWAASRGGVDLIINQDVQHDILALQNSGLDISVRLVHSEMVNYTESGSSSTDLSRLQDTDDGHLDDVHKWRNTYSADLVQLLALVSDTGGIGYLLNRTTGNAPYAFTLVRIQQAGWSYTSIHEFGHNLGCHHRKDQAVQPGPGLFSYSAGWRWMGSDGNRYCSIMSYQDAWDGQAVIQAPYFSSPLIDYMGAATGDALDADNTRTIQHTGPVVGSYRKKQSSIR